MTRVTRLVGGGFAALLIAPWIGGLGGASASTATSGDPRATTVDGNATTCADVGFPGDSQFGSADSSGNSGSGFDVSSDGQNLTVNAIPDNTKVDVLVVKGGDAYNTYDGSLINPPVQLPVGGFQAPLVGNQNVPVISHWFLCYGPADAQPPVVTPPSADVTGDCDVANVTLHAGTDATQFLVTRAGDAGTSYPVGAGDDFNVPAIPVDANHSTVTVTANGQTLKTFSRNNAVCDAGNGGDNNGGGGDNNGGGGDNNGGGNGAGGSSTGATVTNPATSASNACKSGITVTLSNLGATVPVTFTLTAPDGSTSTVTVGANQRTTRSFAVTEDSTGSVTVTAPGLPSHTFSYHKDCVTVLGVKHVRHHHRQTQGERTKVLGSGAQARQLPFTGFNARGGLVDGGLTIGLGLALCVLAARRREQPAPVRRRR